MTTYIVILITCNNIFTHEIETIASFHSCDVQSYTVHAIVQPRLLLFHGVSVFQRTPALCINFTFCCSYCKGVVSCVWSMITAKYFVELYHIVNEVIDIEEYNTSTARVSKTEEAHGHGWQTFLYLLCALKRVSLFLLHIIISLIFYSRQQWVSHIVTRKFVDPKT